MADEQNINEGLTPEQIKTNDESLARHNASLNVNDAMPDGYDEQGNKIEKTLIDGKFESQEDFIKAYHELQNKLSALDEKGGDDKSPTDKDIPVVKDIDESGVSEESFLNSFTDEYDENGELSKDSYKKLADKGYAKHVVDELIDARVAKAEVQYNKVVAVAGSEEQYNDLVEWAADNLDDAQKVDYNNRISSKDSSVIEDAVNYLLYKREQSGETPVKRINGEAIDNSAGIKPFKDMDELRKAHANPLYGTNEAFTLAADNRYMKSLEKGTLK